MATRRRFLGILGAGAVSAPLAAKELAEGKIGNLAGINPNGYLSSEEGIAEAAEDAASMLTDRAGKIGVNTRAEAASYLRKFGKLPDYVERKLRDEARNVGNLDYDIANKRSWSLAVKVQEQRQRNYERNLNRYREGSSYGDAQEAFKAATGFKWPW